MSEFDPETGKLLPTWTIRFSPWMVLAGSFIGGAITGGVILLTVLTGDPISEEFTSRDFGQMALLVFGLAIFVFLLLGPVMGWGVGFALRNVTNDGLHVLAFAVLGLFVGYSVGEFLGRLAGIAGLGTVIAPAAGIGAAAGRWAISKHARI